jgi:hypothetical protein
MNEKNDGYLVLSVRDLQALLRKAKASAMKNIDSAVCERAGWNLNRARRNHCVVLDVEILKIKGRNQVQIPCQYTNGGAEL